MKYATVIDKIALCLVMVYFAASKLFMYTFDVAAMMASSVLIAALAVFMKKGKLHLRFGAFHLMTGAFLLYCLLSFFWAKDGSLTIDMASTMLKTLISLYPFYLYYRTKSIDGMLKGVMLGGYLVCLCILMDQGINVYLSSIQKGARVLRENSMNANELGIVAAISLVINLYFLIYDRKIHVWTVLAVPALICLSGAGSRASLIVLCLGTIFLLVLKNYNEKRKLRSLFRMIAIFICFGVAIYYLMQFPFFSILTKRVEIMLKFFRGGEKNDVSMSERSQMLSAGFDIIKRSPIWGVGINNPKAYNIRYTYLHNNYLEVFAGGGVLGFVLYYSMHVYVLASLYKYRKFRTRESDVCLVLVLVTLALELVHVSLYNIETFLYLLIYFIQIGNMKRMARLEHGRLMRNRGTRHVWNRGDRTAAGESA